MRRESVVCSGAWLPLMARLAGINPKDVVLCLAGCGQSFGRATSISVGEYESFESGADKRSRSDSREVEGRHVRRVDNR